MKINFIYKASRIPSILYTRFLNYYFLNSKKRTLDLKNFFARKKLKKGRPSIHFFGFRGDEYNRAKKIWGEPDFIHPVHDRRAYIEIDTDIDILIFANKERPEKIRKYRREYTDMKKVVDLINKRDYNNNK